jgi:hypothetical protein
MTAHANSMEPYQRVLHCNTSSKFRKKENTYHMAQNIPKVNETRDASSIAFMKKSPNTDSLGNPIDEKKQVNNVSVSNMFLISPICFGLNPYIFR